MVADVVILQQRRTESDEDPTEHQGAKNPVKQHAVLVDGRNREEREHNHEYKDVVERQRLLDEVSRKELQSHLTRGRIRIKTRNLQEPGIPRELPWGVPVEGEIECQRQADPHGAPNACLAD